MGGVRLTELADRAQLSLAATSELVNDLEAARVSDSPARPRRRPRQAHRPDQARARRDGRRRRPRGRHRAALVEARRARRTSRRCAGPCSVCSTNSTRRTHEVSRREPTRAGDDRAEVVDGEVFAVDAQSRSTRDSRSSLGFRHRSAIITSTYACNWSSAFEFKDSPAQRRNKCQSLRGTPSSSHRRLRSNDGGRRFSGSVVVISPSLVGSERFRLSGLRPRPRPSALGRRSGRRWGASSVTPATTCGGMTAF